MAASILTVSAVALAILLVGVRLFGYVPYAILSPSMTPTYCVGDLVYVKKTPPEKIEKGDTITFVANKELTLVTHRVDDVDREKGVFYTKGDANESRDNAPVIYKNVVGVVRFSLPKLGYISNYISTESGRYVAFAVIGVLLLLMLLPSTFGKNAKKMSKGKSESSSESNTEAPAESPVKRE